MNDQISHLYEPCHPAVLRLLKMTVDAAKRKGIQVGVCGELAGDARALPIWLGLDVDELSMSSHTILQVKERLLCTKQEDSRRLLDDLLKCRTSQEIYNELSRFNTSAEQPKEIPQAASPAQMD